MNSPDLSRARWTPVAGRSTVAAVAMAALAVALTGCQPSGAASEPEDTAGASAPASDEGGGARIATVVGEEIDVFAEPGAEEPEHTLASPNDAGADRVFLVEEEAGDWLRVLLPVRPNGSTGWVRDADVELSSTDLRVEVDLAELTFAVYEGGDELRSGPVGTGVEENPTPPGRYFVTELVETPDPGGAYGPYAFGLSGFSPTLETFAGGPGQMAIHGTDDEGALGTRVSHGCIRVGNDDITWMTELLPLGTPVEVRD
ncbi:L,D-transpeptidase [Marinitenerispora sediminis]|nr:L,D-transpeptidase [Marinitenerispora sediminis]